MSTDETRASDKIEISDGVWTADEPVRSHAVSDRPIEFRDGIMSEGDQDVVGQSDSDQPVKNTR